MLLIFKDLRHKAMFYVIKCDVGFSYNGASTFVSGLIIKIFVFDRDLLV